MEGLQDFYSDGFMMYTMKVVQCTRPGDHNWAECPYAHPGEAAARRIPASHTGIVCPDLKKTNICPRGDDCPFAHGMCEFGLHPTRFRTVMCTDGEACARKFCFFAHTPAGLRQPEVARQETSDMSPTGNTVDKVKYLDELLERLLSSNSAEPSNSQQGAELRSQSCFSSPPLNFPLGDSPLGKVVGAAWTQTSASNKLGGAPFSMEPGRQASYGREFDHLPADAGFPVNNTSPSGSTASSFGRSAQTDLSPATNNPDSFFTPAPSIPGGSDYTQCRAGWARDTAMLPYASDAFAEYLLFPEPGRPYNVFG